MQMKTRTLKQNHSNSFNNSKEIKKKDDRQISSKENNPLTTYETISESGDREWGAILHNVMRSPLSNNSISPTPQTPGIQLRAAKPKERETSRDPGINFLATTTDLPRDMEGKVQAKLTIGEPNDKYEQEADRVAKQVVNSISSANQQPVQRMMPEEEERAQRKIDLQRKATTETTEVDSRTEKAIIKERGGGQPLADYVRFPMEQAFGTDFSGVRVHTDAQSDNLNRSIRARAFTTGQDLFFRQGEYNPGSKGGSELVAHELTHVVQQGGGKGERNASIVRRKLSKQELNVVGEDHKVSGQQRESEKKFCKEKTGSKKYWTENIFPKGRKRFIDYFIDMREPADPWDLRMLHYIELVRTNINILEKQWENNWSEEDRKDQVRKGIEKFLKYIVNNYMNLKKHTDGKTWRTKAKQKWKKPEEVLKVEIETGIMDIINGDLRREEIYKTGKLPLFRSRLANLLDGIEKKLYEGGTAKPDNISKARSDAMHEAAKEAANREKGVWKVGDAHRKDMEKMGREGYALTSKVDFDTEYDEWIRERQERE